MFQIKYCVAQVSMIGGKPNVSFYAYLKGPYGLHQVSDWDDPNVLWYDTVEEAKKQIWPGNHFECVLSRGFENGKGC